MKFSVAIALLLFMPAAGYTQINPELRSIGVDQGLSQNSVYALFQDSRGYLWIGTADGLNRYNGFSVKSYKFPLSLTQPFNANFVRGNMAEDEAANIWYTTENGLYKYDRSADSVKAQYIFSRDEIRAFKLTLIRDGTVWMFSPSYGFATYSIPQRVFSMFPHKLELGNQALISTKTAYPDDRGNIWFPFKPNDGLYRLNTKERTLDHFFTDEDLTQIAFVRGGHYRTGRQGITHYDSATRTSRVLVNQPEVTQSIVDFLADNTGHIWIATQSAGIWMYDPATESISLLHTNRDASSPGNRLTCLLMDRQKNLWIGTDGAGVLRFNTKPLRFNNSAIVKPDLFTRSIWECEDATILVASLGNPVYTFNPVTWKFSEKESWTRMGIYDVSKIYVTRDKHTWLIHRNQISVIGATGNLIAQTQVDASVIDQVYRLMETTSGQMLLATSHGLALADLAGHDVRLRFMLTGYQITCLQEDEHGSLWAGTRYSGMFRLTKKTTGLYDKEESFFPAISVNDIHFDQQNAGILWVACSNGLIRFNVQDQSRQVFTETNGLANNHVYGILEDTKNNLWLSTNGGISCFEKESNSFTNYTNRDGLQSNEFNTAAFHAGVSGKLYFGGISGFNWFYPDSVTAKQPPPSSSIIELNVNETAVPDSVIRSGRITLPYDKNDLVIRFAVFDFTRPESNKIKYTLSPIDNNKVRITNQAEARYTNLSPGTYVLTYSGSNTPNSWEPDKTFTIVIEAPVWKRTWFYVLIATAAVGLVILFTWMLFSGKYRARIAELEKLRAIDEERQRISREMHDDIGAGLTQISLMSEFVKNKTQEGHHELTDIADTSRKMVNSMSEIIWSLNPDNKSLPQLLAHLREKLNNQLEHTGIPYTIRFPDQAPPLQLSNEQTRNLLLIAREVINNAIKHSNATELVITATYESQQLKFAVTDNGVGFNVQTVTSGNGLRNIRARVNQVNGSLSIESAPGKGSVFRWSVVIA